MSLFDELRRRRVFRVLATYAAVAFIVLQVADLIVEPLGLPGWIMPTLIVLSAVGLVMAVGLAWAFDLTPSGIEQAASSGPQLPARTLLTRIGAVAIVGGALTAGGWYWVTHRGSGQLDPTLVTVFPFHMSGADATLGGLGEGMVDLFAMKLQGDAGPRAVEPRLAIAAWRGAGGESRTLLETDLLEVGRKLGSARILTGQIVVVGGNVVINASLIPVRGGRRLDVPVEGSADSVTWLVDRLARSLLSLDAGEYDDRLPVLASASTDALVHYLRGQSLYRRGDYPGALNAYLTALERDSMFVAAGLGVISVTGWAGATPTPAQTRIAANAAWSGRNRLSAVDRATVHALLGDNYPKPPSEAEKCLNWERARALAPQRTELSFWVADCVFHYGLAFGISDFPERARILFQQSLAADSSFVPTIDHLIQLAAVRRDTAELRALAALLPPQPGGGARITDWYVGYARNDTAALRAVLASAELPRLSNRIAQFHIENAIDPQWADSVHERMLRDIQHPTAEQRGFGFLFVFLPRGELATAVSAITEIRSAPNNSGLRQLILATLYGELDTAHGRAAAAKLASLLPVVRPAEAGLRLQFYFDSCLLAQWQLLREGHRDADSTIAMLEAAGDSAGDDPTAAAAAHLCAQLLRGVQALATNAPDMRAHALRLDSASAQMMRFTPHNHYLRFVAARLFEAVGDHASALRAIERRTYLLTRPQLLEIQFKESGRLAERLGDRQRAIAEYRQYLVLRTREDEAGRAASAPVRAALARLLAERAN